MELSKEIIMEVIKERTTVNSSNQALRSEPVLALKEAELFLSSGLSIAVHILLGHTNCQAKDPSRCAAVRQLEVWTLKVLADGQASASQQMPPMFLRQAIRSQLHFSPTKSWFSTIEQKKPGFCCLFKISTSSHFEAEDGMVEEHRFPLCRLEGRMMLQTQVKWLKKDGFPGEVPQCPSNRIDDEHWVFPSMSTTLPLLRPTSRPDSPPRKKSLSRQNSKEVAFAEGASHFDCASHAKSRTKIGDSTPDSKALANRRISSESLRCSPQRKSSKCLADDLGGGKCIGSALLDNQRESRADLASAFAQEQPPSKYVNKSFDFHPVTRLPLTSSPAPLKRIPQKFSGIREECPLEQAGESQSSSGSESELAVLDHPSERDATLRGRVARRRVPSGLLCNFEESALNGRLEPVNSVEGFKLQIAITGTFSQLAVPVTTFYFKNISEGEESPSLYLGHCNLSGLKRKALHIPKRCTLQAVLFNPQGSVVKIFLVSVDVSDMPPRSKTFIRQRTMSVPTHTDREHTGNNKDKPRIGAIKEKCGALKPVLKFLIHLRLASDGRSRVFLHSDIKMLLSNKGTDLEGLEVVSTKLDAVTQMPHEPKYSPIK